MMCTMGGPFLIVAFAGDAVLATAAVASTAADVWTITLACGDSFPVVGEDRVRRLLDRLDVHGRLCGGDDRDDPETGAPLPPGVEGYRLGRRRTTSR
jgi:hypothetical protein